MLRGHLVGSKFACKNNFDTQVSMSAMSTGSSSGCQSFVVTLRDLAKCGKPLEPCLQGHARSGAWRLREVYDGGAIADWKRSAASVQRLCRNDPFVTMHDVSGDFEELRCTICTESVSDLVVSRRVEEGGGLVNAIV